MKGPQCSFGQRARPAGGTRRGRHLPGWLPARTRGLSGMDLPIHFSIFLWASVLQTPFSNPDVNPVPCLEAHGGLHCSQTEQPSTRGPNLGPFQHYPPSCSQTLSLYASFPNTSPSAFLCLGHAIPLLAVTSWYLA